MNISYKKMNERARVPLHATDGSAGADLFACVSDSIVIQPGERVLIPTGIAIGIPYPSCAAFIFPRSSISSKYGISLANCVGVIDSDYRGEIKVPLINHSSEAYTVKDGDRIAQIVFMPVIVPDFVETEQLPFTARGAGGFGSTGR